MKSCTSCGEEKSYEHFYRSSSYKDGYGYRCKSCDSKSRKAYHEKHYKVVREKLRDNQRKFKYGLTKEKFDQMLEDQNGCCSICKVELSQEFNIRHAPNRLVVDHCHDNGYVRGLLCTMCNKALGLFKEDLNVVRSALKYLELNKEEIH